MCGEHLPNLLTNINPTLPTYQNSNRNHSQTNRPIKAKRRLLRRFVPEWLLHRANPAREASGTTARNRSGDAVRCPEFAARRPVG